MNRLAASVLLIGTSLAAQSIQSTLLELNGSAPSKGARPQPPVSLSKISKQLTDQMMTLAQPEEPPRELVRRFSEDLISALAGRTITTIQATALDNAISDVMRGKGAAFVRANVLWQTLSGRGVETYRVQTLVDRFTKIAEAIHGPDDTGLRDQRFK
jgi:hypothetical protein